jgi:hypothetical protein
MWAHQTNKLDNHDGVVISIYSQGSALSYKEVLGLWVDLAVFRDYFLSVFADIPYSAYRWETPPVTVDSLNRPFEFVVLDSPGLDRIADRVTFGEFFKTVDPGGIAVFPNLGGDAILIVPTPVDDTSPYSHLGAFLNSAPRSQLHAFWKVIGATAIRSIGSRPLWLSTAGGGVSWLHVRLDQRPKYYAYRPYCDAG